MSDVATPSAALDHVVILVHAELDAAADAYRRLGFHLTPRGHHSLGSSNNLAIFQNNYLELLGFEPGKDARRPELWRDPPGLSGLVWRCPDPKAVVDRLKETGVASEQPLDFVRPVETEAGIFDAAFTIVGLPRVGFEDCRSFFCRHKTPELVWRPEWQQHPNGALDVSEFVFAGEDPKAALGLFDTIFGPNLARPTEGGFAFQAAEARIEALTLEAARERYGDDAPMPSLGPARMIALGLRTTSLDQTRSALKAGGVFFTDLGNRVRVGRGATFGLAIDFHE